MRIYIEIEDSKIHKWAHAGFQILSGIYLVIGARIGARAIGISVIGIAMMLLGIVNVASGIIAVFFSKSRK